MNKLLAFAALVEVVTGVALIVAASLFARLLLGTELSGVAVVVGRVAGMGLLALGLACWPGAREPTPAALGAMTIYGLLVAVYLCVPGNRWRVGRPAVMAGRGVARRADLAVGTHLAERKEHPRVTVGLAQKTESPARSEWNSPGRSRLIRFKIHEAWDFEARPANMAQWAALAKRLEGQPPPP